MENVLIAMHRLVTEGDPARGGASAWEDARVLFERGQGSACGSYETGQHAPELIESTLEKLVPLGGEELPSSSNFQQW